MTDKAAAFEALLDELSTALADVVDAVKAGQESSDGIASSLADIVDLLESRKDAGGQLEQLVSAIKAIRIKASDVSVNVSPTPVTVTPVVQVIERVKPGAYEMTFTYDRFDRLQAARLVPVAVDAEAAEPKPVVFGFPQE